jgi:16S rRNA (guanine527-N7)-methyltransferase
LRTVLAAIGRTDVAVARARGEDLAKRGAAFDVAVSRATLAPAAWLALGARLVVPGGSVWVLLAKEEAPTATGTTLVETVEYTWPNTGARRVAARYSAGAR